MECILEDIESERSNCTACRFGLVHQVCLIFLVSLLMSEKLPPEILEEAF
jgi:hypothetical protein